MTKLADEKKTNALVHTSEEITAAGALSLDYATSVVRSGGAIALTLADATDVGHRKRVIMAVDGGTATLTPATFLNGTSIAFADAADAVDLEWTGTQGWALIGNTGAVAS